MQKPATCTENSGAQLTSREQEILNLLLEGVSAKEIAYRLRISYRTVDFHKNNLYRKQGVGSIQELLVKNGSASEIVLSEEPEKAQLVKINNKRIGIPVFAGIAVILIIFFLLKPSLTSLKPSHITEMGKAVSVSLASEDEPFIVTLNDSEPWGYSIDIVPFPNNTRITEGDTCLFTFSFTSNVDIEMLYVLFVDITGESGEFFVRLSPNGHLKGNISADTEYTGTATVIINKSASSTEPNANILGISTTPYSENQPTLTFTKLDIIKLVRK